MREITSKRPKASKEKDDSDDDTNELDIPQDSNIPEIRLNGAATGIVSPRPKPIPPALAGRNASQAAATKEAVKANAPTKARSARGKDPRAEELMKLAKMISVRPASNPQEKPKS
jgi:hypothetical protein